MSISVQVAPSDTVHVEIRNVNHSTSGAVTSGLTGSVSILDNSGSTVAGPTSVSNISGSTWGANIAAPSTIGDYTIAITFDGGSPSAHRTIKGNLAVR